MDEARYRVAEQRLWSSLGREPTERRVHLPRTDVTVRVQELGDGPPVLFVHGASTSGSSWATLMASLAGFRCITLDRPGTGLSDALKRPPRNERELAGFADDLVVDVLDGLGLPSADLVGTSFGGYVTLRTAAAHPDRLGRIVELGWTVGAPATRLPVIMRLSSVLGAQRLAAALPANERMVRAMFRQIGLRQALAAGRIPQEVIDCYVALFVTRTRCGTR